MFFLEILQTSQENTYAKDSFLNKVAGVRNFIKRRVSGTGVLLWILQNFEEHLFLKNTSGGCFYT